MSDYIKITPNEFMLMLSRIQAELARRNGNGDLSSYAGIDFNDVEHMVYGESINTDGINTLITGLQHISSNNIPTVRFEGDRINKEDMFAIDRRLYANEQQPRGATTNNDCANLCSGTCVTECTMSCLSTCLGSCYTTCELTCSSTCANNCVGGCKTSCQSSCTAVCSAGCGGNCSWGCDSNCGYTCPAWCAGPTGQSGW